MPGKVGKLRILTRSSKDLSIARGNRTATLALQRTGHDCGPTRLRSSTDNRVDEINKLIRESNGNLLAHPIMVPDWYQHRSRVDPADAISDELRRGMA